jgi:hypothetical protein
LRRMKFDDIDTACHPQGLQSKASLSLWPVRYISDSSIKAAARVADTAVSNLYVTCEEPRLCDLVCYRTSHGRTPGVPLDEHVCQWEAPQQLSRRMLIVSALASDRLSTPWLAPPAIKLSIGQDSAFPCITHRPPAQTSNLTSGPWP